MKFNQKFLNNVAMVDTPETLQVFVAEFGIKLEDTEAESIFNSILNARRELNQNHTELSDDDLEQITGGAGKGKDEPVKPSLEEQIQAAKGSSGACSVSWWGMG